MLSIGADTLFLDRTAECCVKHSRADRMRAQNAALPLMAKPPWSAALPGLGLARWHWVVLPLFFSARVQRLRGTAASPKVHHGTAAPLEP